MKIDIWTDDEEKLKCSKCEKLLKHAIALDTSNTEGHWKPYCFTCAVKLHEFLWKEILELARREGDPIDDSEIHKACKEFGEEIWGELHDDETPGCWDETQRELFERIQEGVRDLEDDFRAPGSLRELRTSTLKIATCCMMLFFKWKRSLKEAKS